MIQVVLVLKLAKEMSRGESVLSHDEDVGRLRATHWIWLNSMLVGWVI